MVVNGSTSTRQRILTIISIFLTVPLGFVVRFHYHGPASSWISNFGGGILYEIFWMLVIYFILLRRRAITPIAVGVCVATCLLEMAQLWQPDWLQAIRAVPIGRVVLGTTFTWWDFPAYPIGCFLGWVWLKRLAK